MAEKKNDTKKRKKFSLKRYFSPAFLLILAISFSMWYLTKLNDDYTAEIPVLVNIGGNEFKVTCVATASGHKLLARRVFSRSKLDIPFNGIATTPSVLNPGRYVISPSSLQTAISLANNDIKIISIGDIPEITYKGVQ